MMISDKLLKKFERYKSRRMGGIELFKFEINLLIDPETRSFYKEFEMLWEITEMHHRNEIIKKLDRFHHALMNDPENKLFSNQIRNLFP